MRVRIQGLAATVCLVISPAHVLADEPTPARPPPEKTGYKFVFHDKAVYFRMPPFGAAVRGKLDKEGIFIPDPAAAQRPGLIYPEMNTVAVNDRGYPNELYRPLSAAPKVEFVYEYRSGVLILGHLMEGGYFVPRVGSKVIPFADYVPGPGALRIYNLPGEFVPLKK